MKRVFVFVLRLALLLAVILWLADRPGTAHIIWHDYVIETSAAVLGLCALVVGFGFYLLFRFWHFLSRGPEQWRLGRKLTRLQRGHDHLTAGLVAVAGGNAAEAGKLSLSARKHLGVTPATQLLQAQAAQLAGDHRSAKEIFRSLAEDATSAVLGYRGLIMEARRENNWADVDRLIEKLHLVKPKTPWLSLIRFESAARREEWVLAHDALSLAASSQLLDAARTRYYRAVLNVALAQNEARHGFQEKALSFAEQAMKQMPDWLPAALTLAHAQMGSGHKRAAHRTIEKNWAHMPHPQLAAVFRVGDADPIAAYKQVERLCRGREDEAASRLALADAALAADIWGEARRHLITLISRGGATQNVYRMMARLERRESGDEQAALQWMTKAADASADPVWLCRVCGGSHADWQPLCRHCGSFATLEWHSPGVSRMSLKEGTPPAMLGAPITDFLHPGS